ncbi:hypothetical protein V5799_003524 [Amblyomma americanum]|uniref:Uncharacterized protein n=1 Tax=Amblyomma americanum TaxID=6943 RepID=A0AAQ4D8Q0_AMBAM
MKETAVGCCRCSSVGEAVIAACVIESKQSFTLQRRGETIAPHLAAVRRFRTGSRRTGWEHFYPRWVATESGDRSRRSSTNEQVCVCERICW